MNAKVSFYKERKITLTVYYRERTPGKEKKEVHSQTNEVERKIQTTISIFKIISSSNTFAVVFDL